MLSVLARVIDIAMVVAGALIAAALHRGNVWFSDLQRTMVLFDCLLVVVCFPHSASISPGAASGSSG